LFAAIQYFTESAKTASPETTAEARNRSWAFLTKYVKSGKLKHAFWFADGSGGISIWDFDSADELYRVFQENPSKGYVQTEVQALVTYTDLENIRKEREASQKPTRK